MLNLLHMGRAAARVQYAAVLDGAVGKLEAVMP
jgi:hypothetical protein